MIKKEATTVVVIKDIVSKEIAVLRREVTAANTSAFAGTNRASFFASSGAFGEVQKGNASGFTRHYTRRS